MDTLPLPFPNQLFLVLEAKSALSPQSRQSNQSPLSRASKSASQILSVGEGGQYHHLGFPDLLKGLPRLYAWPHPKLFCFCNKREGGWRLQKLHKLWLSALIWSLKGQVCVHRDVGILHWMLTWAALYKTSTYPMFSKVKQCRM